MALIITGCVLPCCRYQQTGFYTGYIASAITLGRFVSAYPLGHVTDSIGRKPVIIGGLLSIMMFSVTFGLSTNFAFAMASRCVRSLVPPLVVFRRVWVSSRRRLAPPTAVSLPKKVVPFLTQHTSTGLHACSEHLTLHKNGPRARCQPHR